ncbi:hypothetical protein SNEBB_002475 [Seison nebaliae]|nr:hypothetical protein SNEBB_002475 [Seison nebaliae]
MWYNVLPSIVIVTGLVQLPNVTAWMFNYFGHNGHKFVRNMAHDERDLYTYTRDLRIKGTRRTMYRPVGLEGISDEPEAEESCHFENC